ncbi:MAG: hypothetical protein IKR94_08030, partial [Bacteroidales bacterium]|nr:hypothetical protein [Bacteroidales bacterium]
MQKFCQYCGAQYEGRADSRFCSNRCRSAFNNRRRKSEIGDLDGSDEDEDEPVNDFDDDEDEPINGYEDDDTADEDTENDWDEEENEEEDEEEEEEE